MPDAQIYVQDYHVRPEKVRSQSTSAKKHAPKIGDPTPLGLSAFAISVMISALYNLKLFGVQQNNILVGVGLFTGGVVQFTAGMWAFKVGSTFGGTGFSAYGGFWLSYAVVYIPGFGIKSAFGTESQFQNAMGIFLSAWLIFTIIFTLACIRTNVGVLSAFVFLSITFLAEVIYSFSPTSEIFIKFAGVSGLITSGIVWYCLAATLLTPDLSPINLPLWDLSRKDH